MSLTLVDGITIGAVGGFLAGITVWLAQLLKKSIMTELDKRKIYKWLHKEAEKTNTLKPSSKMAVRWMPTENIACFTNLPIDRVRYICSIHKEIVPKLTATDWIYNTAEESWSLKLSNPNHGKSGDIP